MQCVKRLVKHFTELDSSYTDVVDLHRPRTPCEKACVRIPKYLIKYNVIHFPPIKHGQHHHANDCADANLKLPRQERLKQLPTKRIT